MAYQFPPEVNDLVQRQLATGQYDSLIDALRSLQRQQDDLTAIQEAIEDMEAGRVSPLREFDRQFRERNKIPQDG